MCVISLDPCDNWRDTTTRWRSVLTSCFCVQGPTHQRDRASARLASVWTFWRLVIKIKPWSLQGLITLRARLVLMGYSQSEICGYRQKVSWICCTAGSSQCLSQPTFESQANQIRVGVVNKTQVSTWCSKIRATLVKSVTVLIWLSDVTVYDVAVLQTWPHLPENTHHREEPFVVTSSEK